MADPQPLVTHIYTADPSAHVFDGKLYIYPSHDRETNIKFNDNGDQYSMIDYRVLSMASAGGEVTDHGVALSAEQVAWVSKQMWAPDAAFNANTGNYHLYFPARDKKGVFRIGVAISKKPEGPFEPQAKPIEGSYSIDPASFVDDDGQGYLYFGGIWGGQLQCWSSGQLDDSMSGPQEPRGMNVPALLPRVGKLSEDMLSFVDGIYELEIRDESGMLLMTDDHERRFFEAAWMHKYNGKYYFSYSTGDTHFIAYALGDAPLGPFVYRGKILDPVAGWTNHHSIVQFQDKWYIFYHDCTLSNGIDHLRSVKMREIMYDEKGSMHLAMPQT